MKAEKFIALAHLWRKMHGDEICGDRCPLKKVLCDDSGYPEGYKPKHAKKAAKFLKEWSRGKVYMLTPKGEELAKKYREEGHDVD